MRYGVMKKMTGMLLYVDNVVKFLDTPFFADHALGNSPHNHHDSLYLSLQACARGQHLLCGRCIILMQINTGNNISLLHDIATEVSIAAGIRTPEVVIFTDTGSQCLRCRIGPESSYIMVTTGDFNVRPEELEGVIAHERATFEITIPELMTVITVLFGDYCSLQIG